MNWCWWNIMVLMQKKNSKWIAFFEKPQIGNENSGPIHRCKRPG